MKIKVTNRMQYSVSISDVYAVGAGQSIEVETESIPKQLHHAASEGYVFYEVIQEESRKKQNKSKDIETASAESQERSE